MEESVTPDFLELVAQALRDWFPQLEGRALAVSEVDPFDKSNVPKIPVAVVALLNETYDHSWTARFGEISVIENFVIEFMLKPARYELEKGTESPFWTFYDYRKLRDTLIYNLQEWEHGGGVELVRLEREADSFAVYISFAMRRHVKWCPPVAPQTPDASSISFRIKPLVRPGCKEPQL